MDTQEYLSAFNLVESESEVSKTYEKCTTELRFSSQYTTIRNSAYEEIVGGFLENVPRKPINDGFYRKKNYLMSLLSVPFLKQI
jgi:hypothetical protein